MFWVTFFKTKEIEVVTIHEFASLAEAQGLQLVDKHVMPENTDVNLAHEGFNRLEEILGVAEDFNLIPFDLVIYSGVITTFTEYPLSIEKEYRLLNYS